MNAARLFSNKDLFWAKHITLGRVMDGAVAYAQHTGEKRKALATALQDLNAGAVFFLAWTGKWTTDLFEVTKEDLIRWAVE